MGEEMPLNQFILRKSDMQSNAAIFGEYLPGSLKKDIITERLAEIYERNTNEFLSMFSVSALVFLQMIFEKQLNGSVPARDLGGDSKYAALSEFYGQLEYLELIDYSSVNISVAGFPESVVPNDFYFIEHQLNRWQP